jgi:two-component system sensor histidine kinase RegB
VSVDRSAQITLRTLVTARWVLLGLLAAAGLVVLAAPRSWSALLSWLPERPAPVGYVALLVSWAAINLATEVWVLRRGKASRTLAGVHLLVDAGALTLLLSASGGATNPFTTLYFVPITLATQVSPRWTWTLAGVCLAGFAALFVLHPIPQGPPGHEAHFAGHLRGMWIGFAVSGALITVFVHRIAALLARQRAELRRLQLHAAEARHLAAVGSLAAGAAHELGTPLGTIELLVAELPAMADDEMREAMGTVRQQVARCKTIVSRMASPELRVQALGRDGSPRWDLAALAEDLDELARPSGIDVHVIVDASAHGTPASQPREVLGQIARELVVNAVDACRRGGTACTVEVRVQAVDGQARVRVQDDGPGMDAELAARVFDPFFTTKAEGEGTGLGLYLARAQVRQLGGTVDLHSAPGRGTVVEIVVPLHPEPPRVPA